MAKFSFSAANPIQEPTTRPSLTTRLQIDGNPGLPCPPRATDWERRFSVHPSTSSLGGPSLARRFLLSTRFSRRKLRLAENIEPKPSPRELSFIVTPQEV